MRAYCPNCREYRSDNGKDAWSIRWQNGLALCDRCGSVVDVWVNGKCENKSVQKTEDHENCQG
jgi:hypothetical protein